MGSTEQWKSGGDCRESRRENYCGTPCEENRKHKFRDRHPQEPGNEEPEKEQVKEASYADEG